MPGQIVSGYEIILDAPGAGRPQANLTTDFWKWSYSIPDQDPDTEGHQNPFSDTTGEFADVNQSGSVFFLTGAILVPEGDDPAVPGTTRVIDVPRNKEIFLPVLNVEWDNAQLQAFFGTDDPDTPENENFFKDLPDNGILTAEELRSFNENNMETATDMFFMIDGDTLFSEADWGDDDLIQYRQVTPTPKGFNYRIPGPEADENVLGIPWIATDNGKGMIKGGMSDGIWINLKLAPGEHELSFGGTFDLGSIQVDLNGNGIPNEQGKEEVYKNVFAATFTETFSVGVNYDITQI